MDLKQKLVTYWLTFQVAFENWLNGISIFIYEVFIFGKFIWFWKIKVYLWLYYFFTSPYKIVAKIHKKIGIHYDNLIYGETPFITMKHILEKVNLEDNMKFCDLGSGRGMTVFLANYYFKMNSVGLEIVPDYVKIADKIKTNLKLKDVKFFNGDFFDYDLTGFDIIYVPATTWDEETLQKLEKKLKDTKLKANIISVSAPLNYNSLKEVEKRLYPFSWGASPVYFYKKCGIIDSHG